LERAAQEMVRVTRALAYLCDNLVEIRAVIGEEGPLAALMSALHDNPGSPSPPADLARLLDAVHRQLQAAGDAHGLYGSSTRSGVYAPGLESLEVVYRCPLTMCAGRDEQDVSTVAPRCAIGAAPLIREVLD
jgi:hypothetical protein